MFLSFCTETHVYGLVCSRIDAAATAATEVYTSSPWWMYENSIRHVRNVVGQMKWVIVKCTMAIIATTTTIYIGPSDGGGNEWRVNGSGDGMVSLYINEMMLLYGKNVYNTVYRIIA